MPFSKESAKKAQEKSVDQRKINKALSERLAQDLADAYKNRRGEFFKLLPEPLLAQFLLKMMPSEKHYLDEEILKAKSDVEREKAMAMRLAREAADPTSNMTDAHRALALRHAELVLKGQNKE